MNKVTLNIFNKFADEKRLPHINIPKDDCEYDFTCRTIHNCINSLDLLSTIGVSCVSWALFYFVCVFGFWAGDDLTYHLAPFTCLCFLFLFFRILTPVCFIVFQTSHPTNILTSRNALAFRWHSDKGKSLLDSFSVFPWNAIVYVSKSEYVFSKLTNAISEHPNYLINIHLAWSHLSWQAKFAYFFRCANIQAPLFGSNHQKLKFNKLPPLQIPLSTLTLESDRKRFIATLVKYLPEERLDPQLLQMDSELLQRSCEKDLVSYTSIWLDSFESASQRKLTENLTPGTILNKGRSIILSTLASGGQATIYYAQDKHNDTTSNVVLKEFILPIHAGFETRNKAWQNIQKEPALLAALQHPGIVKYLGQFVKDNRAYLILENIDGLSLRKFVTINGSISEQEVVALSMQMCDILSYLHRQTPAIIHRDFTPDNLMLSNDTVKLIDFSVAQRLQTTSSHTVVGKHHYMPPEQFRGKAVTQSDLYSLGCTMHFLLTGKDPQPLIISNPATINPSITKRLANIIIKLTQQDAEQRYADAILLKQDLLLTANAKEQALSQ